MRQVLGCRFEGFLFPSENCEKWCCLQARNRASAPQQPHFGRAVAGRTNNRKKYFGSLRCVVTIALLRVFDLILMLVLFAYLYRHLDHQQTQLRKHSPAIIAPRVLITLK